MAYTVYKHTCPNGKVYIGITSSKPETRWGNGKKYVPNNYFFRAIQKYGWNNIKHEILFSGLTKEEACQKEKELIEKSKSNNRKYGYNLSVGGEIGSLGCTRSEETKKMLSDANKGQKRTLEQRKYIKAKCIEASGKPVMYHEFKFVEKDNYRIEIIKESKYSCINEASRQTGKTVTTIINHCKKNKTEEYDTYFRYI